MKKLNLVLMTVFCLIFGITAAVSAQGFYIDLGYQDLSNDLTIDVPDLAGLEISVNTPCKMYTADLGYEFNNNFSLEANYSWGTTDLADLKVNPSIATIDADFEEDNSLFSLEGKGKFEVAKSFYITGIIGYAEYKTTTTGTVGLSSTAPETFTLSSTSENYSADIEQSLKGTYAGLGVSYSPNERFELGAYYRWMLNPSGTIKLNLNNSEYASTDLKNIDYSSLKLFSKVNINQNWAVMADYTKATTDYSISGADISCDTSGIRLNANINFKSTARCFFNY